MLAAMRRITATRCTLAALASLSRTTTAFAASPRATAGHPVTPVTAFGPAHRRQFARPLSAQGGGDNDDWATFKRAGGNLIGRGLNKVKSIMPFGGKSEEEKAAIQRKKEIKGGIDTMLKDMPLPVRLMGKMVAPLLSRAAEGIAEQTRQAADVLEDARLRLAGDEGVTRELGEPVQCAPPFSQSSSTMSVNGRASARVRAQFQVAGPRGGGIATVESVDGEITTLTLDAGGRRIDVGASSSGTSGNSGRGRPGRGMKDDNIIEAEIIEKRDRD